MKRKGKIYWISTKEVEINLSPTGNVYYAMTTLPDKPNYWWAILLFLSDPARYMDECEVCFLAGWAPHEVLDTLEHLDVYQWGRKVATIHFHP